MLLSVHRENIGDVAPVGRFGHLFVHRSAHAASHGGICAEAVVVGLAGPGGVAVYSFFAVLQTDSTTGRSTDGTSHRRICRSESGAGGSGSRRGGVQAERAVRRPPNRFKNALAVWRRDDVRRWVLEPALPLSVRSEPRSRPRSTRGRRRSNSLLDRLQHRGSLRERRLLQGRAVGRDAARLGVAEHVHLAGRRAVPAQARLNHPLPTRGSRPSSCPCCRDLLRKRSRLRGASSSKESSSPASVPVQRCSLELFFLAAFGALLVRTGLGSVGFVAALPRLRNLERAVDSLGVARRLGVVRIEGADACPVGTTSCTESRSRELPRMG